MNTIYYLFVVLLCAFFKCEAGEADTWRLSMNGFGPIKIGMTLKEAKAVIPQGVQFSAQKQVDSSAQCSTVVLTHLPKMHFIIFQHQIVRIRTTTSRYKTAIGAQIGDLETKIQSLYHNQLIIKPIANSTAHYLIFTDKVRDRAIRFKSNKKNITAIDVGYAKLINFSHTCV